MLLQNIRSLAKSAYLEDFVVDEKGRLEALAAHRVLDTAPEREYDDIVELAAELCATPIALVSLVDEERQWFKAKKGLSETQTARDISICTHAIKTPHQITIIEDASQDPRFAGNPLVTGDLSLRFYAGMPLISSCGHPLGTLCVIDTKSRTLSLTQYQALRTLGKNISTLLELRRNNFERIRITSKLAETQLEMEAFSIAASHNLNSPLQGISNLARWIEEDAAHLDPESGQRITLIQERVQRMKDLLNGITSFCEHEKEGSEGEHVQLKWFTQWICRNYVLPPGFKIDVSRIPEGLNVPFSFAEQVLSHLLDNAIKHHDKIAGQVVVSASLQGHFIKVVVSDDGPGIPLEYHSRVFELFKTLRPLDNVEGAGMGLALAKRRISNLGGKIWIDAQEGPGTVVAFTLPAKMCVF